jgi:hypothetical protein
MTRRRSLRRSVALIVRSAAVLPIALLATAQAQAQGQGPTEDYPTQEQYFLRAEYREFRPTLTGEITHGTPARAGTPLDLDDDLGVDDKRTFEVRGAIQFKRGHKIRASYTPLDYVGAVPESRRPFIYGGTEFQRFDRIASSFKGTYLGASYEWDFVKGPRGYLGAVLGARLLDLDALVAAPDEGRRELDTLRSPAPALGLASRVYFGRTSLEGEFVGFSLGERGSVWELELAARIHISDRLAGMGGYRRISLKGADDEDDGDIKIGGWQFGLELSL